ncbi:MAG TPA: hypothetical protein VFC17_10825 [Candidatus Limnocylindrales bacterium]|nr:hypothetical protein [Candidatus Limnocylindrales bacterium]
MAASNPAKSKHFVFMVAFRVGHFPYESVQENLYCRQRQSFCRACFATSYEQLIEADNRIERHVQSLPKIQ